VKISTTNRVEFGNLPTDAQEMLTRHLRVDFSHCSFRAPGWFSAWSHNERGHITGVLAVEFQTWFEGKITVLVLDPRCLSRRVLRAVFTALFSQAKRLTAEVEPSNLRALRQVQRLGFQFEGHHPLGLEGTRDTIVFGMLKDECPWLPSYVPPSASRLDVAHRSQRDIIVRSDGSLYARIGADRKNLGIGKLGAAAALSLPGLSFSEVLGLGLPADVNGADAAWVAASVRGDDVAFGRSVGPDTDKTVNPAASPIVPHSRVALRIDGKRPEQTVRTLVRKGVSQRNLGS
jgi:hypothetical protein